MNAAFSSLSRPLAITMWDFSWLERRWPGAGYEDWGRILDELVERGYDAVRIDAYPHLVAADPDREWEILPPWNQQDWGSPARVKVRVMPALLEFISECAVRGVRVALSSWFQNDTTERRLSIASPRAHAEIWARTLELIRQAGLMDTILYLDFCNEWPLLAWSPFYRTQASYRGDWRNEDSLVWMKESVGILRENAGDLPLTYSFTTMLNREHLAGTDLRFLDLLEPHRWMAGCTDFYGQVGYKFERFEPVGYENVVARAERLYRSDPDYWKSRFLPHLEALRDWSLEMDRPLVTTEGWAIVDYKDWPGLDWGWVKELSAWSVEQVADMGRWAAICTSNFCGPQFRGMWRDVEWHQRMTRRIHESKVPERKN